MHIQKIYNQVIPIPKEDLDIYYQFKNIIPETYFVGGCIRDFLRNRNTIRDYDLVCFGEKEDILSKINLINPKLEILTQFDNVILFKHGSLQKASPNRKHFFAISISSDFDNDFLNRDFTVNSLYYNPENHCIFGNEESFLHIEKHLLIPCSEKSLANDVNILRAIRFINQLSFCPHPSIELAIDKATFNNTFTKLEAVRLRNEAYKHEFKWLATSGVAPKLIEVLNHFDVIH